MSTNFEDNFEARGLDPEQVKQDVHQAVHRWRMSIRKGRQLLRLTQTETPHPPRTE